MGYGDVVPVTTAGKFIASLTMLAGIIILALPISVIGSKFQEVMINLVSNSLKYTDKGHVTISSKKIDNKVVILIQDTGKGIDPKYQHELFGKFQQASKDLYTRDYSQSTGLGLYITKLLVEQMNGVVRLDRSEVDKGSTFSIVLPVVVDKKDKI